MDWSCESREVKNKRGKEEKKENDQRHFTLPEQTPYFCYNFSS